VASDPSTLILSLSSLDRGRDDPEGSNNPDADLGYSNDTGNSVRDRPAGPVYTIAQRLGRSDFTG